MIEPGRNEPDRRYERVACRRGDLPAKPKGMHWHTYNQLVERYDRYDAEWTLEAMRRFGLKF